MEDQYFTASGILKTLAEDPRIKVMGHFISAEEALESLPVEWADVGLLDLGLPGMNGMELTRELLRRNPELKIIWLTGYPVVELVETAVAFGASTVLYKTCLPEELLRAIFALHCLGASSHEGSSRTPAPPRTQDAVVDQLSPRQRQVLSLIAQGFTTKEIATRLCLSARTVETHREAIMRRLHSENIADMTRIACRNGLVPL